MQYGYARVSSNEQETTLQLDALQRAGVSDISQEKRSARRDRPVLTALLSTLRAGDSLVVYKVDRIARSIRDLAAILDHCADSKVSFRSLTEPFDTTTAAGRMMVQLLGIVAEFEWHMIRDRSMAGQRAAVERGVKLGRPRALTKAQESEIWRELQAGATLTKLSVEHNVALSTVRRVRLRREEHARAAIDLASISQRSPARF